MRITGRLTEQQKDEAVDLLFEAFEQKMQYLYVFQKNPRQAKRILREAVQFDQGVYAVIDGKAVGVAGLETKESGAFLQIRFPVWRKEFSLPGSLFRWTAMNVYKFFQRTLGPYALHIDLLAVSQEAQGRGIGTELLAALKKSAKQNGFRTIVLEVVDTNPGAKSLYEGMGFVTMKEESYGILRVFTKKAGFTKDYKMTCKL